QPDRAIQTDASPAPRLFGTRVLTDLPKPLVIAVAAAILVLVAYLDSVTDPELSFAFWYFLPVVLVTWYVGRRAGYVTAVICEATWLFSEVYFGAASYKRANMAYWNAMLGLAFFLVSVPIMSGFRELGTRLASMVEERTRSLRRISAQLSAAEDSERRRLAYDIHDGFSQNLSVLKMNLAAALPQTPEGSVSRQRIADALGMVNDLIDRSRTLTFDLHPAMLDHLGLVPTLRRYGDHFARQANVEVIVSEDGTPRKLPSPIANYLFRSIKELFGNAARHGQAKQIVAAVHWTDDQVRIVVDDDGGGFDARNVFEPGADKGLGLAGMRERLISLGGNLRLESTAGQGTRVVLEIPQVTQED
ncbi:MAG TPA: sensor histidine kinase, partial [Tepidisphaeraceae bacterium]|nr:sensor histidine kinase [Tepidisphaeraceae bacterium]